MLEKFNGLKLLIYKYLWFKFPINNSKNITYISNFTKINIERRLKLRIKNSQVIPVPLVNNLRFKINNNKRKKILIIGTSENKNIKNMVLGIKGLDVILTIVGEIDEDLKGLCNFYNIQYRNLIDVTNKKIRDFPLFSTPNISNLN